MINEEDFTALYHTHAPKIRRLCMGYALGNQDLANEWFQETFIKVWNHRKSFKGRASVDTWIYRIAVNTCLSDLRKSKKNIPINEAILKDNESDDDIQKQESRLHKMYGCIDQLTEQNKALILLELEDVPQATIAETVGLAHGTLRTRLSRIRKSLLKCITNGE